MSERKKMKNDTSSADNNKKSLLPEDMLANLQSGMAEGFYDGNLDLQEM